jgi:hypothetical protein
MLVAGNDLHVGRQAIYIREGFSRPLLACNVSVYMLVLC